MFDIDDLFGDKDLSNERVFSVGKNKLRVKKADPYGFWSCSYEKGVTPEELSGNYTSFEEARKAIENYFTKNGKEFTEVVTDKVAA